MSTLFRPESVANKQLGQQGSIYLKIPRSFTLFFTFILFVTTIFMLILVFSEYERKENIQGVLKPSDGLVRIYATRRGVIEKLRVDEQVDITPKTPLLTLLSTTHLADGQDYNKAQELSIAKQIANIDVQIDSEKALAEKDKLRQLAAINEQKSAIWQLSNQLNIAKEIVILKQNQHQHALTMAEQGYLSKNEKNNSYHQLLTNKQQLENTKATLMSRKSLLAQSSHELSLIPVALKQKLSQLAHQKESLQLQLKQITVQKAELLQSPVSGRVTAVQVKNGEQVDIGQLLMTILPNDSHLEAELYLPSKAAGFIKKGQDVRLRYDAFPYQRYGLFDGHVKEVSHVTLTPAELRTSIMLTEATYRVKVSLVSQSVKAFGQEFLLQPGMKVEADIVLDRMSLFDWIMMPIYAVKGAL